LQWGIVLLILFAASLHAGWNVLLKSESDSLSNTVLIIAGSAVIGVVFFRLFLCLSRFAGRIWEYLLLFTLFILRCYYWPIKKET
jgi:hypothetical protein